MEKLDPKFGLDIAYLELGRLYQCQGKKSLARELFLKFMQVSKETESTGYLKEAENLLATLEKQKQT